MNNPVRAAIQRHGEARRLLRMGGAVGGGSVLEIGCGQGVGVGLIFDRFGAATVDAFDFDPRMVALARRRLRGRGSRVRLWVGDATAIAAPDSTYDAVFDFGIIHHIPDWRNAVNEVRRVLKPGGRFYAEEVLRPFIVHPVTRVFLEHPQRDRFDAGAFIGALKKSGLTPLRSEALWNVFAWFVAAKPAASRRGPANLRGRRSARSRHAGTSRSHP